MTCTVGKFTFYSNQECPYIIGVIVSCKSQSVSQLHKTARKLCKEQKYHHNEAAVFDMAYVTGPAKINHVSKNYTQLYFWQYLQL